MDKLELLLRVEPLSRIQPVELELGRRVRIISIHSHYLIGEMFATYVGASNQRIEERLPFEIWQMLVTTHALHPYTDAKVHIRRFVLDNGAELSDLVCTYEILRTNST